MGPAVELQAKVTTNPPGNASTNCSGGQYFLGMPPKPISDADLDRAERLRGAREKAGLNQSELGRAMRPAVKPQTVQQWEKGGGISGKYQTQVARVLRITPEYLMFGNVNHGPESSRNHDAWQARSMRLTGAIVGAALAAIQWRLRLVDRTYDVAKSPEILALALNLAVDDTAENLAALDTALAAYIQSGDGNGKTDRSTAIEPADGRARPARRGRRGK